MLAAFIGRHGFATLITSVDGTPFATHIPLLLDAARGPHGTLVGHVARANPHWRHFGRGEALAVFTGPHAYVSPAWYATGPAVPTWNYAAVHAYGTPAVLTDQAAVRALLARMVATYEAGAATPWSMSTLPEEFVTRMVRAIVAFEMPLARVEGKWKLGQNRSGEDRVRTIAALRATGAPDGVALAALMTARDG